NEAWFGDPSQSTPPYLLRPKPQAANDGLLPTLPGTAIYTSAREENFPEACARWLRAVSPPLLLNRPGEEQKHPRELGPRHPGPFQAEGCQSFPAREPVRA